MATSQAIGGGTSSGASQSKVLHIGLWVVQGLLALAFLTSGMMKLVTPLEQLQATMPWVNGPLGGAVRLIGAAEVSGAVGLVLPAATRIKPALTPLAAMGLVTVMLLAALMHVTRSEYAMLPANAVLGGLAAFVAWGRARKAPIEPRS